jgi:hypothetical protein
LVFFSVGFNSDTYNPVPGVMEGVPSSRNYSGGFTSKLMVQTDIEFSLIKLFCKLLSRLLLLRMS